MSKWGLAMTPANSNTRFGIPEDIVRLTRLHLIDPGDDDDLDEDERESLAVVKWFTKCIAAAINRRPGVGLHGPGFSFVPDSFEKAAKHRQPTGKKVTQQLKSLSKKVNALQKELSNLSIHSLVKLGEDRCLDDHVDGLVLHRVGVILGGQDELRKHVPDYRLRWQASYERKCPACMEGKRPFFLHQCDIPHSLDSQRRGAKTRAAGANTAGNMTWSFTLEGSSTRSLRKWNRALLRTDPTVRPKRFEQAVATYSGRFGQAEQAVATYSGRFEQAVAVRTSGCHLFRPPPIPAGHLFRPATYSGRA